MRRQGHGREDATRIAFFVKREPSPRAPSHRAPRRVSSGPRRRRRRRRRRQFYLKAQSIHELQRANQQRQALDTARQLYRDYCRCCGGGVGHQDRTAATQAVWDKVGRVIKSVVW
jgi:hypothetical protein